MTSEGPEFEMNDEVVSCRLVSMMLQESAKM